MGHAKNWYNKSNTIKMCLENIIKTDFWAKLKNKIKVKYKQERRNKNGKNKEQF